MVIFAAIFAAVWNSMASTFDAINFDPLGSHRYCVIGTIILLAAAVAVLWRVFGVPAQPFLDSLRAVFSSLWRVLRRLVRLYRYCCTSIVSLIPNTISLLCQCLSAGSLSAGSLSAGFLFATVIAVAALIGYIECRLLFPAPTRSLAARTTQPSARMVRSLAARTTQPSARMVRNPRSASGSTLRPVQRFLRNMPSRWRIAGTILIAGAAGFATGSAGVVPDEVSPLDFFVAQVHRIPRNVFVATGAILLGAIPYEDVWNYVSDTGNRYENLVRRARRNISPGASP